MLSPNAAAIRTGEPTRRSSHLNQITLLIECLCFLLHSLSRATFRTSNEKLGEAVLGPTVRQITCLLAKMVASQSTEQDTKITEADLLSHVFQRERQYAEMPSILGKNLDDRQSAYQVAALTIAEALGRPRHAFLVQVIRTVLLRALNEMDFVTRVRQIEENI